MTAHINIENGLCIWHDPTRKGKADAMRVRAGKAGARAKWERSTPPAAPQTLDDAVKLAAWITRAVLVGDIDPKRAQEATRAVGQFTRGLKERDLANEVTRLKAQLERLAKDSPTGLEARR